MSNPERANTSSKNNSAAAAELGYDVIGTCKGAAHWPVVVLSMIWAAWIVFLVYLVSLVSSSS